MATIDIEPYDPRDWTQAQIDPTLLNLLTDLHTNSTQARITISGADEAKRITAQLRKVSEYANLTVRIREEFGDNDTLESLLIRAVDRQIRKRTP